MAQHYDIQNWKKIYKNSDSDEIIDNPNFDQWYPKLEKSIQHWLKYLNFSHMKSMCLEYKEHDPFNYRSYDINKSITILPQEYLWGNFCCQGSCSEIPNIVFKYKSPIKTKLIPLAEEEKVCDQLFEVHGIDRKIHKIYLVA
jgi:hypothetical protein